MYEWVLYIRNANLLIIYPCSVCGCLVSIYTLKSLKKSFNDIVNEEGIVKFAVREIITFSNWEVQGKKAIIFIHFGQNCHQGSYLMLAFYIYIIYNSSILIFGFELASQAFCILILTSYWIIAYTAYLLP